MYLSINVCVGKKGQKGYCIYIDFSLWGIEYVFDNNEIQEDIESKHI